MVKLSFAFFAGALAVWAGPALACSLHEEQAQTDAPILAEAVPAAQTGEEAMSTFDPRLLKATEEKGKAEEASK